MAWVGNPSSNSRVPIRVSTRSGVMILAGIGVLNPSGVTVSLIALCLLVELVVECVGAGLRPCPASGPRPCRP